MRNATILVLLAVVSLASANMGHRADITYDTYMGITRERAPKPSARSAATVPAKAPAKAPVKAQGPVAKTESDDAARDIAITVGIGALASYGVGAALHLGSKDGDLMNRLTDSGKNEKTTTPSSIPKSIPKSIKESAPKGASIPSEVFNLVKAIVGVGVLSLPAGVAAFGDAPSAFIPAGGLIAIIGILSAYGFALIGKVCAYTGATSYKDAWSRTVGESTAWIPAWSTTCKTFLACLAFSMVLADTFSSLFEADRTTTLLSVTALVLLPLCLKKNLKSLAPFSLLGVLGMIYTAVAMTIRWLDGTYVDLEEGVDGGFLSYIAPHLRPEFGDKGIASVLNPSSLILVCMLSTAYMAHFNAPKFYYELENNTIPRFHAVVSWSFGISIFLMGFITMVGFLTFGNSCDGLVLNNYASNDPWMSGSRIAVAISLVFSYPLAFTGFRDGFLDLSNVPLDQRGPAKLNSVTMLLLGIITVLAVSLRDVSFVLALGGATLGNALTYVYPALMYRQVVKQQNRSEENVGVFISMVSAVLGIAMGVVGANMALKS